MTVSTVTNKRPRRYPWRQWFKKKAFTVVRGLDFDCQVHGMASNIRNAAVKHRKFVSLDIDGDRITVLVRSKDD